MMHLAVHSAASSWQSLLQLHDLAALLCKHPDLDWPALLARAAEWRCRRRLLTSLAVTAAVWEMRLPQVIAEEIAGDGWIKAALARCRPGAADRGEAAGRIAQLVFVLWMMESWRDRARILVYKITNRLVKLVCRLEGRDWGTRRHQPVPQSFHHKPKGESYGTR